jgi:GNAT superfamily N-acetyltransferase
VAGAEERAVTELIPREADRLLAGSDLSDWFQPFLAGFARETVASGGRAVAGTDRGHVVALLLTDRSDGLSSLFARTASEAAAVLPLAAGTAVFSEVDLGGRQEVYRIHTADLGEQPDHRFQHPVRRLPPSELERALAAVREVFGGRPDAWLRAVTGEGELCLVAEVRGSIAGVGWLGVSGRYARLHTLAVRPGYRRLGVASDLIAARLWWARRLGADRAIAEIAEENLASRTAAERLGLRADGRLFLHLAPPAPADR